MDGYGWMDMDRWMWIDGYGWIWMDMDGQMLDEVGRCRCHWYMQMSLVDVDEIGRCWMMDVDGYGYMDGWIWMDRCWMSLVNIDVIGRCICHWQMQMSLVDVG